MPRYFLRDTPLEWIEKFMMLPPNYKPRGGGLMISRRFVESFCNCRYCLRCTGRKTQCADPSECLCFEERLKHGYWSFYDLFDRYIQTTKMSGLENRCRKLIAKQKDIFINEAHRNRMDELATADIEGNRPFTAAAFLISADQVLWQRTKPAVLRHSINFKRIDIRGIGIDGYVLYKAAKFICHGANHLSADELCDERIIGDDLFRLIVSAFVIRRYGLAPLTGKERRR